MPDDQDGGTPGTAVAEPVTGQVASAETGTSNQNGSAVTQAQSAPAAESFSNIDPNTLPPELKAVYKNLQADYTKKTMLVAEKSKKADAYDAMTKDPRFVDYWQGLNKTQKADFKEQKAETEKTLGQKITDERFQKAFETKDGFLELLAEVSKEVGSKDREKLKELEQYKTINEASAVVEQFATELGEDGKSVRPDFYSLDEDKLISGYLQVSMDPAKRLSPNEYTQKLSEAYTWAKGISQKYYEKGRTEALARIQQKVAGSSEPPTQAVKGAYTGPDPKNVTPAEALQFARKGIRVPRYD